MAAWGRVVIGSPRRRLSFQWWTAVKMSLIFCLECLLSVTKLKENLALQRQDITELLPVNGGKIQARAKFLGGKLCILEWGIGNRNSRMCVCEKEVDYHRAF